MYFCGSIYIVIAQVRDFSATILTDIPVFVFAVTLDVSVLNVVVFMEAVLGVLLLFLGFQFGCCERPFLAVSLVVEFFEEEEEHHSVHSDPPNEGTGVIAVDE